MRLALAMGCYDPPAMPMTRLMKWWQYHQAEPGAFPGNRYPKAKTKRKTFRPQPVNEQINIFKGLTQ